MTALAHTPEPWFVHANQRRFRLPNKPVIRWYVSTSEHTDDGLVIAVFLANAEYKSPTEAEANAKLLLAAPRLLRFVKEYVAFFVRNGFLDSELKPIANEVFSPDHSVLDEALAMLRELGVRP